MVKHACSLGLHQVPALPILNGNAPTRPSVTFMRGYKEQKEPSQAHTVGCNLLAQSQHLRGWNTAPGGAERQGPNFSAQAGPELTIRLSPRQAKNTITFTLFLGILSPKTATCSGVPRGPSQGSHGTMLTSNTLSISVQAEICVCGCTRVQTFWQRPDNNLGCSPQDTAYCF